MSEKICTSGHVMNDSDVACGRCGASEQLSNNNLNTNMENDENKVVEGAEVSSELPAQPAAEEKLEGETVAVEPAPETPVDSEVKDEATDSPEASEEAPKVADEPVVESEQQSAE